MSLLTAPIILNQSGRKILSDPAVAKNLLQISSGEIIELLQDPERERAEGFSPALKRNLQLLETFLSENSDDAHAPNRHEVLLPRIYYWSKAAIDTIANRKHPRDICRDWSKITDEIILNQFSKYFSNDCSLIALGKWSSHELNLSSDIDLMIFSNSNAYDPNALKQFKDSFDSVKNGATTYRVDLDLRPGGRMGPVISQIDQAEDYYLNFGQTWERVALIRFRCINQDFSSLDKLNQIRQRFCFRRHLDYSVIEDLKKIRHLLLTTKQKTASDQLDLKFCPGGIRDIELYLHSMVVIHGGKIPALRTVSIDSILDQLQFLKLLSEQEKTLIQMTYWDLRRLENYTQSVDDQQTHLLDLNSKIPDWARRILLNLSERLNRVTGIVNSILGENLSAIVKVPEGNFSSETGAELDAEAARLLNEILDLKVLSRNRASDEAERIKFVNTFCQLFPQVNLEALSNLRDFIKATRAKATFFSFLNQHPSLIKDLSWIFSNSQYMTQILKNRPEILDTYWLNSIPEKPKSTDDISAWLLEKKMLSEMKMASALLQDADPISIAHDYSFMFKSLLLDLKDSILENSELSVVMFGKLATNEMSFKSDLDLAFISNDEPCVQDTKLARRFISRLTEPQRGGRISEVDLRLRPSGNSGPLVTSERSLSDYILNFAKAWERQAYLRCEVLGNPTLTKKIKTLALNIGLSDVELSELSEIRLRLLDENIGLSIKSSEGGTLDIELALQTICLQNKIFCAVYSVSEMFQNISHLVSSDPTSSINPIAPKLLENYLALRKLEMLGQVVTNQAMIKGHDIFESNPILARLMTLPPNELLPYVKSLLDENAAILSKLDPRRQQR